MTAKKRYLITDFKFDATRDNYNRDVANVYAVLKDTTRPEGEQVMTIATINYIMLRVSYSDEMRGNTAIDGET